MVPILMKESIDEFFICQNFPYQIKTHSSVSAAKKTRKDLQHTSVIFTGIVKLLNSAFCISKTTKPISTKFIDFLSYIIIMNHASGS